MIVKAWIDKGIINCMSQKCTEKMIKENPDSETSTCPRINICKEYGIIIKESEVINMCEQNTLPADEVIEQVNEDMGLTEDTTDTAVESGQ